MIKWFYLSYWKYLLAKPAKYTSIWKAFNCRRKGHAGIVWYNPNRLEPDMHCIECGDDLG